MIAIGTKVKSDDSYTVRVGSVVAYVTNRWGCDHVVEIAGGFERVTTIDEMGRRGIGWSVASADDVARAERQAAWDLANADAVEVAEV